MRILKRIIRVALRSIALGATLGVATLASSALVDWSFGVPIETDAAGAAITGLTGAACVMLACLMGGDEA